MLSYNQVLLQLSVRLRDELPGERRATRLKLSSLSSQIVFARAGFVFMGSLVSFTQGRVGRSRKSHMTSFFTFDFHSC